MFKRAIESVENQNFDAFLTYAVIAGIFAVGELVLGFLSTWMTFKYTQQLSMDAQTRHLERLFDLDEETVTFRHEQDLMQRLLYDSSSLALGKFGLMVFYRFLFTLDYRKLRDRKMEDVMFTLSEDITSVSGVVPWLLGTMMHIAVSGVLAFIALLAIDWPLIGLVALVGGTGWIAAERLARKAGRLQAISIDAQVLKWM